MATFELIIGLLFGGCLLVLLARRVGLPYPALLAVAGAALAFVPAMPKVTLDPSLALALFVAPVLLNAGYDTSLRDLRDNWRPVAALSVVVVCVTALTVAVTARAIVPQMPWSVAATLGAIVSPPDATAVTAILRRLHPPHRLLVVLEGESLLNDATALLIWRLALMAAVGGGLSWGNAAPAFLLTAVGGVVAGYVLARLYLLLTTHVDDTAIEVLLQFLATFSVWLLADRMGMSAIVTMVVFALTIARSVPFRVTPQTRIASNSVWEVAVLGLSILAFIMMALQLQGVQRRLHAHPAFMLGFAVAVCGAVIGTRIVWVALYNVAVRWKNRHFGTDLRRPMTLPTWRTGAVVAWSGMRGIVTLATALAIPAQGADGHPFPYRDLLVFTAFCVVLATLVLQGLTLPLLLSRLDFPGDDPVGGEIRMARAHTARAALATLEGDAYPEAILRREYRARLHRAVAADASVDPPELARARQRALAAERALLAELRATEAIGDAAFRRIEQELDLAELDAQARTEEP